MRLETLKPWPLKIEKNSKMYIYLDTSQLSQISYLTHTSSDTGQVSFEEFFRQWNQKNAQLCLSLQHLRETSHLKDKQSREARLSILKNFKNLRFSPFGWPSIIQNEAIVQMVNHISSKNYDPKKIFKKNFWEKTNAKFLLNYVDQNLDKLRESRKINEAASEIEEIFKPVRQRLGKYLKRRINDLKAVRSDNLEEARKIIEQLQSSDETDGVSNVFIKKIFQTVRETGSISNALISLLKLEGVSDIEKRYLSDASSLAVFYRLAREAIPYLAKIVGVSERVVSQYIVKIDLSSCPGFSLRTVLLRALHSSYKKFDPSDWVDADHIVYAPYVDIFFADKRTCEFLHQETRNQPFRIKKSLISNIRRIVPLNKLLKEISI